MTWFRVWAPNAQEMQLSLGEQRIPMQAAGDDWWSVEVDEAGAGADYGFCIDGEGPFPDPRSAWQPQGIHGPSRVVDHSAFLWTDENFQARPLAAGLIYEIHVGAFTEEGTFDSAILKLDYLHDLGVTHLELMPVAEFPGEYGWGYDGVDLYAPEHAYGGPEGLKRLVDACHAHGIAVILDVVYNHVGPAGNYLDKYGPYHSDHHQTNWGPAMNFDGPGSDEVRSFFIDNAKMWLRDYHIDGLRLDAVHAIVDNSAVHFLEELAIETERLELVTGRHLILIAESDMNDPRVVRSPLVGGYGIDAQWSDDFHHALHVLLTGEQSGYYAGFTPWDDLAKSLTRVFVYDGSYSELRGRKHGRPIGDLPGSHFLGYIQNHDQVGNRAHGERFGQLVGPDLAKVAAAIMLTSPFDPLLFMGEEWDASTPFQYFTDHEEELGRAVTEGRRNEFADFGWKPEEVPDPQEYATFQRSKLKWDELGQEPHTSVLEWYRQLITLRRKCFLLADGHLDQMSVEFDRTAGWLVINHGPIGVACNLVDHEMEIPLENFNAQVLLASNSEAHLTGTGAFLPQSSVLIFIKRA